MEADAAGQGQNQNDREHDDFLHVLRTGAVQPGVNSLPIFPSLGQPEIGLAGNDRYLHTTNDSFASYPPTLWPGDCTSGYQGDLLHNASFDFDSEPLSFLQQDGSSELYNLCSGMGDSVHSGAGSFDFASAFPHSEASSTNGAGLEQLTDMGNESLVASNDDLSSSLPHNVSNILEFGNRPSESKRWDASMSEFASRTLEHWLESHSDHPYPTKEDNTFLKNQTGLTSCQLSTWLENARKERKGRHSSHEHSIESRPGASLAVPPAAAAEEWPLMSPIDRWRHSPPEIEAAPLTAIMNIVTDSVASESPYVNGGVLVPDPDHSQPSIHSASRPAPSVVSSKSADSRLSSGSGSSASSLNSNQSNGSFGRFYANETRRRRRRRKVDPLPYDRPRSAADRRQFQCTFCTDTFKTKHDWTRHEKTLHLSLESWVCAPFGATFKDTSDGLEKCAFCDVCDPSESHVESHRYHECRDKPSALRTFYRKDHLCQHLRLVHNAGKFIPPMEKWKSEVSHINSRCGFCGQTFVLWSERNDHIAHHFRKGVLMKDWQGCRGLDPPVALAVENAMPPYLVGIESSGLEPFSASRRRRKAKANEKSNAWSGAAKDSGSCVEQTQPSPFEYLTAQLRKFVQQVQATGTALTDEMIQQEARCIVFGDGDPWNQTAADNGEWLKLFKEGMGLDSTASIIQPDMSTATGASAMPRGSGFRLPWSANEWAPYTTDDAPPDISGEIGVSDTAISMEMRTPWSWQSPECLAEFRRYNLLSMPCTSQTGNVQHASLENQMFTVPTEPFANEMNDGSLEIASTSINCTDQLPQANAQYSNW